MDFRAPKVKRFAHWLADPTCQYPAALEKLALCAGKCIIGKYNGSNVVVDDPNFILMVYSLGCFGKGSLSRSEPNYSQRKSELVKTSTTIEISNELLQVDKNSSQYLVCDDKHGKKETERSDPGEEDCATESQMSEEREDRKSEPSEEFQQQETLHLNLEEAYFLSYCLGTLTIVDLFDKNLTLLESWRLFCESQDDFVQKYVVYHHYRSKGWVVKPGLKFGGDFVLYKYGPHITHASYIVIIEVIKEDGNISEEHQQPITWGRFISLNRMAESAGKEVILCRVIWPNDVLFNDVQSPDDLKKFSIVEVMTRRWVSSQERELIDKEEIGE